MSALCPPSLASAALTQRQPIPWKACCLQGCCEGTSYMLECSWTRQTALLPRVLRNCSLCSPSPFLPTCHTQKPTSVLFSKHMALSQCRCQPVLQLCRVIMFIILQGYVSMSFKHNRIAHTLKAVLQAGLSV